MLLSLNTLVLVYLAICLEKTFVESSPGLTPGECKVFNPSEYRAYYRMKGRPKCDVGLTTGYVEQSCSHSVRFVNDPDLPKPPNEITVQVDCLNQTANIIWNLRIRNDKAKKLSGFLLEVKYVETEDSQHKLRYLCYRILLDEAILLSVFDNKQTLLEFELPCFKSAVYAYMGTSVLSILSQNKMSSGSSRECSYRVYRKKRGIPKYETSLKMQCPSDCNYWRPHLSLQIVTNEPGECKGLRLHLYNVTKDLSYLRVFIVHNESGEVVLDQVLNNGNDGSSRELIMETSSLKKSGRYCAKLEICCKEQISSTCYETMKFVSDFVSCMVTSPPAKTTAATSGPEIRPEIHPWIFVIVGLASIGLIFIGLCFVFRGHFGVYKECNTSCFT